MKINKRLSVLCLGIILLLASPSLAQEKYIKTGDDAYRQYQYQTAAENYKKARSDFKGAPVERDRITARLAEIYFLTNDWKMASGYYKKLEKSGFCDLSPECLQHYATTLQYLGDDSLAIDRFEKYMALVPGDSLINRKLKGLKKQRGNPEPPKYSVDNAVAFNSNKDDFGLVFSNRKEEEVIFTSTRKGATGKDIDQWTSAYFSDLFKATLTSGGKIPAPTLADNQGLVNTEANEGVPFMNSNYSTLYCTRCEQKPEKKSGSIWCYIIESKRNGSRWTKPEVVYSDPDGNTGHATLTDDELLMVFAGSNEKGLGKKDLWMTSRVSKNKPFGPGVNLGALINTPGDEVFPMFRNDTTLYFASEGHGGYGGLDIFKSTRLTNGEWSAPENMGSPINSNSDDFAIAFKKGVEEGYFSSNRAGGKGGDDLYHFRKIELKLELSGNITDAATHSTLGNFPVLLIDGNDTLSSSTDGLGHYQFDRTLIRENREYSVLATYPGYFAQKQGFSTQKVDGDRQWRLDFEMVPIPESPIVLPQILYELDQWALMQQYQDSLRNLVTILNDNPKISIELRSHTDARANDQYNDELSQKRAQTVVDFLISQGIEPVRLQAKGYGKRSPRRMDADYRINDLLIPGGTVLDEAYVASLKRPEWQEIVHQMNRRTEFSVIPSSSGK
ncbi:MAG: OmpA family protein [Bacteroidales bacterium]|nr:OmpA family protein [Bacteroidales bacterium]